MRAFKIYPDVRLIPFYCFFTFQSKTRTRSTLDYKEKTLSLFDQCFIQPVIIVGLETKSDVEQLLTKNLLQRISRDFPNTWFRQRNNISQLNLVFDLCHRNERPNSIGIKDHYGNRDFKFRSGKVTG